MSEETNKKKPAAKKAAEEKTASVMHTSSSINLLEGTEVAPEVAEKAAAAEKAAEAKAKAEKEAKKAAAKAAEKAETKTGEQPAAEAAAPDKTAEEPEAKADIEPEAEAEAATEKNTASEVKEPEDYELPEGITSSMPAVSANKAGTPAAPQKRPPKPPKTAEQLAWEAARKEDFNRIVWRPWIWPMLALVCICLATSLLLGLTNMFTAPLIEQNAVAAANKARTDLLPQADGFEEIPITSAVEGATALYKATNDTGYVAEAYGRGYGGKVPVMVAFDSEGGIVGVTFMENDETPGLGQKITEPSFAKQFEGLPGTHLALSDVDKIASATITTGAGIAGVNAAIDLYNAQVLGVGVATTPEEINAQLLPGETFTPITINAENTMPEAWRTSEGNYIIHGLHVAEYSTVGAVVAMNENGEILNLWLDTSGENPAYGGLLATNREFLDQFIGKARPVQVDAVADVTGSSSSVMSAVNNALAALPQAKEAK